MKHVGFFNSGWTLTPQRQLNKRYLQTLPKTFSTEMCSSTPFPRKEIHAWNSLPTDFFRVLDVVILGFYTFFFRGLCVVNCSMTTAALSSTVASWKFVIKSHPKDWRSPGSNPRHHDRARSFATAPRRLLVSLIQHGNTSM